MDARNTNSRIIATTTTGRMLMTVQVILGDKNRGATDIDFMKETFKGTVISPYFEAAYITPEYAGSSRFFASTETPVAVA